ncbi:MAG: hypothetical protein M1816_001623 [Peltula sp. TS41687]|nr:MAG: hypothetical protein M1816_001623 [Peltula sp. TS41687]
MSDATLVPTSNAADAVEYLKSLLGHRLRITTTDTRMFVGEFKCTDNDSNVILAGTHELRQPQRSTIAAAAAAAAASSSSGIAETPPAVRLNMTSRYLGLVVVPGQHIIRVQVEEPIDAT